MPEPGNECSDHLLYSKSGRRFILYLERTVWHKSTISHPNGLGENDTLVTVTFTAGFTTSNITVQAVNSLRNKRRPRPDDHLRQPGHTRPDQRTGERLRQHRTCRTAATYAVAQQPTVTNYTWSVPAGAIGLTGQGSNSVSFTFPVGYTGGTISVIATNGCGTSTARNLTVATLSPATPSVIDVVPNYGLPEQGIHLLTGQHACECNVR